MQKTINEREIYTDSSLKLYFQQTDELKKSIYFSLRADMSFPIEDALQYLQKLETIIARELSPSELAVINLAEGLNNIQIEKRFEQVLIKIGWIEEKQRELNTVINNMCNNIPDSIGSLRRKIELLENEDTLLWKQIEKLKKSKSKR